MRRGRSDRRHRPGHIGADADAADTNEPLVKVSLPLMLSTAAAAAWGRSTSQLPAQVSFPPPVL